MHSLIERSVNSSKTLLTLYEDRDGYVCVCVHVSMCVCVRVDVRDFKKINSLQILSMFSP